MHKPTNLRAIAALVIALLAGVATPRHAAGAEEMSFERDVRPILKVYCFDCHGAGEKLSGQLDLRLKRFAESGGKKGPALLAGMPAKSRLIERMKTGEMPPGEKKVPADQIAIIETWIASGAKTLRPEPEKLSAGIDITPEERAYWFYQPVRRPEVPRFEPADRVRTPIDALVLERLKRSGLGFAPDADRLTLIRRAALDLTGLPPAQTEIDAFVADANPLAYEKMIDRLLASPHYGERWGRHWLDVAGYADSDGNGNEDTVRPYAYKYRDYVIRSLNADKPFSDFIIEQLAGDELVPRPWKNLSVEQIDKLAATGFLRTAPDGTSTGGDTLPAANQMVTDTLKIVSSSLLGLTVACAQCHDHKYDPIPQADYYRMRAVFEPALDPNHWRRPGQRLVSLYTDADRAKASAIDGEAAKLQTDFNAKQSKLVNAAVEKELAKHAEPLRGQLCTAYQTPNDKRTAEQRKLLESHPSVNLSPGVLYQYDPAAAEDLKKDQAKIAAKRAEKPVEDFVSVTDELPGTVPATHIFYRGDYRQPKQAVKPGDLTIAAPAGYRVDLPEKDPKLTTSGRRLAFAKHLVNGKHPLVYRVLVNRVWLHHFGRGLVDTPGDFGLLGLKPTNPELLDWLADEWVRTGWSLKALHRQIMTSTVYRQAASRSASTPAKGDNALYSKFPVQRLEAEAIRDRILAASGSLDRTSFGSPVPVEDDFVGQVIAKGDSPRRSIYLQVRRTKPISLLAAFDAPGSSVNCDRRVNSTAAPQALMLMNSDFVLKHAGLLAKRLPKETPANYANDLVVPLEAKYPEQADVWRYGVGSYDAMSKRVTSWANLSHWTGSAWQGGPALPDPKTGWAFLSAVGGHPGENPGYATVRRWIAPKDGIVTIAGRIKHLSTNGDGVRGRLVSSRTGLLGEWSVKAKDAPTEVAPIAVSAGDTLDFVTDNNGTVTSDSFEWVVKLTLAAPGGNLLGSWDSAADFRGPAPTSLPRQIAFAWNLAYQRPPTVDELDLACRFVLRQSAALRASGKADPRHAALTNLCQQLLSSNEFLYVD